MPLVGDFAEPKAQALLGKRLFEKAEGLNGFCPPAGLTIGIGRHEDAGYSEAVADLVGGIDTIARSHQTDIHQHHVRALALGNLHRLIGRDSDRDNDVAQRLQQALV